MSTIKNGGRVEALVSTEGKKIESIDFEPVGVTPYVFEMWLNRDSLSYLSLTEMLAVRDNINAAIEVSVNSGRRFSI